MDYQSNSHKNKAQGEKPSKEDKKIEKIVTGEVVEKKKNIGRKFKDIFFGGDFKTAAGYVAGDIILPSLRNMFADAAKGAVDRVIFGESAYSRRRVHEMRPRVSYNNPIRRDPRDSRTVYLPDQPPHPYRQNRREANDIIIGNREEAEAVVERLIDIVDQYDEATLADLYELLGLPHNHVDQKWGWTFLKNAEVRQTRDGYLLDLPPLEAL